MSGTIADINAPAYVWARTYSHTDRRNWLEMLTDLSSSPEGLIKPDREDVFLIVIRTIPLDNYDPIHKIEEQLYIKITSGLNPSKTSKLLENRQFLGATWSEKTPNKLRVSTRQCLFSQDVVFYAESDAKDKGHIPLVLQIMDITAYP